MSSAVEVLVSHPNKNITETVRKMRVRLREAEEPRARVWELVLQLRPRGNTGCPRGGICDVGREEGLVGEASRGERKGGAQCQKQ